MSPLIPVIQHHNRYTRMFPVASPWREPECNTHTRAHTRSLVTPESQQALRNKRKTQGKPRRDTFSPKPVFIQCLVKFEGVFFTNEGKRAQKTKDGLSSASEGRKSICRANTREILSHKSEFFQGCNRECTSTPLDRWQLQGAVKKQIKRSI